MAEHHSCLAIPAIDVDFLVVRRQDLNFAVLDTGRINKYTATVVVRCEPLRDLVFECSSRNLQNSCSRAPLTLVLEALERATTTRAGKEGQLPTANDLERLVADLEFTPRAAVVAAGAQAEVCAASPDVIGDAPVALAIQHPAVAQVRAAGNDEQCACRRPRFLEDNGLIDGDDSVVWREKAAEGEDALPDRLGSRAGTWPC